MLTITYQKMKNTFGGNKDMYNIDDLLHSQKEMEKGKWVIARPINYKFESFCSRIKDAWLVLVRKADAVRFYKQ